MSNIDKQLIDEEAKALDKLSVDKKPSNPPTPPDPESALTEIIVKHVAGQVQQKVEEAMKGKSGKVEIVGQPRVIVDFPEVTKVSGIATLIKRIEELTLKIPGVQKITGTVRAVVEFPETQNIHGTVKALVDFPDTQKVEVINKEVKEVQKVTGEVKTGLPIVEGAEGNWVSGKPGWYMPVRLFNGKRFYDLFENAVKSSGSLATLLNQMLIKFGALDSNGNALVRETYVSTSEDNVAGVIKVEQRYTTTRVTADGQIKASAGFVHSINISPTTATPTAGLITVYDSLTETGTILFSEWVFATNPAKPIIIDSSFAIGLYVGYDATVTNISVSTSWR